MANNPGAKKAIRKIARRTEVNKARRSRVRTYLRQFEEAVAAGQGFLELAQEGAHARAASLVDFGAAGDLADRLLGAGRVGHCRTLDSVRARRGGR